jgi:hypothetical protein
MGTPATMSGVSACPTVSASCLYASCASPQAVGRVCVCVCVCVAGQGRAEQAVVEVPPTLGSTQAYWGPSCQRHARYSLSNLTSTSLSLSTTC